MPKIGTVEVRYSRSIQPKQYESAQSEVKLSLLFADDEAPNVDEVIEGELDRVRGHVERALGIGTKTANHTKPATAKPATPAASKKASSSESGEKTSTTSTTATKPASPSKPKAPAKPKSAPAPAAKEAEEPDANDAPQYQKGDLVKAISSSMTALKKNGITDGNKRIEAIVRGYLPEDKPPYSYTKIPQDCWADFISDVEKLKDAE